MSLKQARLQADVLSKRVTCRVLLQIPWAIANIAVIVNVPGRHLLSLPCLLLSAAFLVYLLVALP